MTAAKIGRGQISLRVSELIFDPVTRLAILGDGKDGREINCLYPHHIRALS